MTIKNSKYSSDEDFDNDEDDELISKDKSKIGPDLAIIEHTIEHYISGNVYSVWTSTLISIQKNWSQMNILEKIEYLLISPFLFVL